MEFIETYNLTGLIIGICTFLIIGLFHPVVIKAEYYWGTGCWWIFSRSGNRGDSGRFVGDERAMVFSTRRVCLFFFLDDQGDFRAGRTSA